MADESARDIVTPSAPQAPPPPRDLHNTSDIRFVMHEIGKLSANVDRLIADVSAQGEKIDELRHQATFVKGGLYVGIPLISIFIAAATFFLSSKWDAVLTAIKAVSR